MFAIITMRDTILQSNSIKLGIMKGWWICTMAEFKDIMKTLRTEKGLSQWCLAEELGVSKSTVAMWEAGNRFPGKRERK